MKELMLLNQGPVMGPHKSALNIPSTMQNSIEERKDSQSDLYVVAAGLHVKEMWQLRNLYGLKKQLKHCPSEPDYFATSALKTRVLYRLIQQNLLPIKKTVQEINLLDVIIATLIFLITTHHLETHV
jgi:hypothetical protein